MSRPSGTGAPRLDAIPPASRSSVAVRTARRLARDAGERRREGRIVVEGIHLASEALRTGAIRVRTALVSARLARAPEAASLIDALARTGATVRRVDDRVLADTGDVETHQGILLVLDRPLWREEELVPPGDSARVLVACGVQDPGNLGALARCAEAAWASGLALAGPAADPFSPRALRASAGSLLRLPVAEYASLGEAAAALRARGLRLVGASPGARTGYREAALGGRLAIVVGGEGAGLPAGAEAILDQSVSIPMNPAVESLNVAAAAAVLLFEAASRAR